MFTHKCCPLSGLSVSPDIHSGIFLYCHIIKLWKLLKRDVPLPWTDGSNDGMGGTGSPLDIFRPQLVPGQVINTSIEGWWRVTVQQHLESNIIRIPLLWPRSQAPHRWFLEPKRNAYFLNSRSVS